MIKNSGSFGDSAAHHAIKEGMAVRTGKLEPVESVDLSQRDVGLHGLHLSGDQRECLVEIIAQSR